MPWTWPPYCARQCKPLSSGAWHFSGWVVGLCMKFSRVGCSPDQVRTGLEVTERPSPTVFSREGIGERRIEDCFKYTM